MAHVLIVEDQPAIARLLSRWVEEQGAHAVVATGAEQALLVAAQHAPAVALCDIHLPGGHDGFWFLEQLRLCHPTTVAVMTTGQNNIDTAVAGLRAGVTDFVPKPYSREQLAQALGRALTEHTARAASLAARLGTSADAPASDVQANTTAALLTILHADNVVVARQAQRVSRLSVRVAEALGLSDANVSDIEHAALLHHVRRLDIHAIVRNIPVLVGAGAIAIAVEERFDGSGFPLGLRGAAIPLGARIVGLAGVYDELTVGGETTGLRPHEAVERLCGQRAAQFDPEVLQVFRTVASDLQTSAA
jgi:response regulator RpfG family c-di-GMP phosphodiesterase